MLPLVRWSPLKDLSSLHRDMDELFNRMLGKTEGWLTAGMGEGYFGPPMDCAVKDDKLTVRVELPGIDPKDVEISVAGNVLTVKGERSEEKEHEEKDYYVREIGVGRFERTLTLPEGANTEKIKAGYKNGILEISMPAKVSGKARKVEIETAEEPRKLKAA